MHNHQKLRINVFLLFKKEPFISIKGVGPPSQSLPCFYNSPQRTNKTLAATLVEGEKEFS